MANDTQIGLLGSVNDLMAQKAEPSPSPATPQVAQSLYDDDELLDLFKKCKRESFEQRWIFERQWCRNTWYLLGRQWIEYATRDGQWKDKRLAKWIPRPVTNKCKETVQAIRAMFASVKIGVNIRPNGNDPKNVSAAATANDLAPLLHDLFDLDHVFSEFDWWLIVTGNAFLHTYWEYDTKHGVTTVRGLQCPGCGEVIPENDIATAGQKCPDCGSTGPFPQATDPTTGEPAQKMLPKGKGVAIPLSPFELAFPNAYPRFSETPYVIRLRWRTESYYRDHPVLKDIADSITYAKGPEDKSMQIFKALSTQNDLGLSPTYWSEGTSGSNTEEGTTEYEMWVKPTEKYPQGLVFRVAGEKTPVILHLEETEALPGPFPYTDVEGQPLFPFAHAGYDHVGGRILASGALDPIIQKQDQLNQLDSMIQMIIQRMANPVWLEPKGAEVEKFTGEPGLVVKWNPLTVGGNAKPERIAGEGPHGSFFQIREMYLKDIEELTGTFDILKGAKPTDVSAFSAMQLLKEVSQSRFSSVFQARGDAYKDCFSIMLELERKFGPESRTLAVLSPTKQYTFKNFKNAQLQGSMTLVVEDGSTAPKTNLGVRATVEHLNQLGFINAGDSDQKYKIYQLFGMAELSPSLDGDIQSALQKQQAFEEWISNPQLVNKSQQLAKQDEMQYQAMVAKMPPPPAPTMQPDGSMMAAPSQAPPPPPPSPLKHTPLAWHRWYNPIIHRLEFMKWANSDAIRQLLQQQPQIEGLLDAHLAEIEIALAEAQQGIVLGQPIGLPAEAAPQQQPGKPAGGAGAAMANSNKNAGKDNSPKGNKQTAQNHGPA